MSTEEQLLVRARSGDLIAFEQLINGYEKKIYNLTYRMTHNHEDASDLVQEAFLKAYLSLSSFKGESRFDTWLFRIASNLCIDFLRKKSRRHVVSMDEPNETEDSFLPKQFADESNRHDPEYALQRKEQKLLIEQEIAKLPYEQKVVLLLREYYGYNYEEIASILDISVGTVKSRLHRGRLFLRDRFASLELFPSTVVKTIREGEE